VSDRIIHPVTEDFIDGDEGGFSEDDVVLNKLAFSFKIDKGSWEGDPDLGHEFAKLARATNTAANQRLVDLYAREAVQWIIDDGDIDSVDIIVEEFRSDAVAFQVTAFKAKRAIKAGPFLAPYGAG
jgi:phage gp46-like protein